MPDPSDLDPVQSAKIQQAMAMLKSCITGVADAAGVMQVLPDDQKFFDMAIRRVERIEKEVAACRRRTGLTCAADDVGELLAQAQQDFAVPRPVLQNDLQLELDGLNKSLNDKAREMIAFIKKAQQP